jgi:multiple antibiotic resistance protein
MKFGDLLTVTLTLFAVIDILGSIPIIIDLRKRRGEIASGKATIFSGALMIGFLFGGKPLLNMIGIDVGSFAIAGSIVIFIIGLEMVLGISIFKSNPNTEADHSIMPLAFPLIAGAGTLTTILSLKADYDTMLILIAILVNLLVVYIVLKLTKWLEIKMGPSTIEIFRRIFGVILLAIAIKIFKSNLGFIG